MGILDAARQLFSASTPAQPTPSTTIRKKTKPKNKVTVAAKRPSVIAEFKQAARERGYKNITVSRLLAHFGYQKRSESNLQLITGTLDKHGLTVHPALSTVAKLSQTVRIYSFPVIQLGDLFEDPETAPTTAIRQQRERALEDYIERHDLFALLGLKKVCRQYSPLHTQDRFDFLCRGIADGEAVVLELKHAGGGKSAVEQVLRYLGMLRQEAPSRPARGILVTGVRDVDTAKALHGMTLAQQQVIEWYLYRYDKKTNDLSFEKVKYDFIEEQLHKAWHADVDNGE